MAWFSKLKKSDPLIPPAPRGHDTMMEVEGIGHTERELLYLAQLSEVNIDLEAGRMVTFMFMCKDEGAALGVVTELQGSPFEATVTNSDGRLPFWVAALTSQGFAIVPGLATWSVAMHNAAKTHDAVYDGWSAVFPEVGPEAIGEFQLAYPE